MLTKNTVSILLNCMIKRSITFLTLFLVSTPASAKDFRCLLKSSYDNIKGKIVKQNLKTIIFGERYFPLQVYIDENAHWHFRDAVLNSITIWNDKYNDYLNKNSKSLVWKGVQISKFRGLSDYRTVIPSWGTRKLFTTKSSRYTDVIVINGIIDSNFLGTHESKVSRPYQTLCYSLIKIDEDKILRESVLHKRNYVLQNVIMHELGHALGLTHFDQTDPLMEAFINDCKGICPISDLAFEEFLIPFLTKKVELNLLMNPWKWKKRKEREESRIIQIPACDPPPGHLCP